MKWLDGARTRLRLLLSRRGAESRMDKEFRFHIDMEADRLLREEGVTPAEARRRALAAFGGVEKHKEALRDGRGLAWVSGLSLDVKLGARTLKRYPGVTIVGALALAIGIGLGAAYLEIVNDYLRPTLPLPDGNRIVGLRTWDVSASAPELRSMHDFRVWQAELESIEDLSAFRTVQRNVGVGGSAEPATGAEISAAAFQVARVPPMLGRTLVEDDQRSGAPAVVVLGYDVWRTRFAGDPTMVGRSIQLGRSNRTVIGVMPQGFGFPLNHQFWVPLGAGTNVYEPRQGPAIQVFGRLASGISIKEAQAELAALGQRASADLKASHETLRPTVVKYTELFVAGEGSGGAYLAQILFIMLLLLLSSNVATMVFARTATREHEIAMRFALGASRARILGQFFVEALVLALGAAALGLFLVQWGAGPVTRLIWDVTDGRLPFWIDTSMALNGTTVLYAVLVAVVAAWISGVVPALKATRSRAGGRLRHAPGAAGSGLRFGGLWSAMIVVQVAFAVLVVPPAIVAVSALATGDHADPGFAAKEFLSAHLEMDGSGDDADGEGFVEFQQALDEMRRRLAADPAVSRVTFASRVPSMSHPDPAVQVEAGGGAPVSFGDWAMASSVAVDYFDAFGAPIRAGRGFNTSDLRADARVVVVNEHFVDEILEGRNPVGRRMRYQTRAGERAATGQPVQLSRAEAREPGQWYEIVGVVQNLGMDTTKDAFFPGEGPGVYHPLTCAAMEAAGTYSVRMAFHVRGSAEAYAPKVRELAHAIHPGLRVYDALALDQPVDRVSRAQRRLGRFFSWMTALVASIALLISVAGTYSLMAFTVSRQTREIGIRIALGADSRRIIAGAFSRTMVQFAVGIVLGAVTWFFVVVRLLGGGDRIGLVVLTAIALMVVALAACGLPVRRALRIEPTEALRNAG